MKIADKSKTKTYRITRDDYLLMRRDKKAKTEIKALVLMLFDKVKNWR